MVDQKIPMEMIYEWCMKTTEFNQASGILTWKSTAFKRGALQNRSVGNWFQGGHRLRCEFSFCHEGFGTFMHFLVRKASKPRIFYRKRSFSPSLVRDVCPPTWVWPVAYFLEHRESNVRR